MLKRFLKWLSKFGKSDVLVWARPNSQFISNGELIFLNTWLRLAKATEFRGMKDLCQLSRYLNRRIIFCERGTFYHCPPCREQFQPTAIYIEPCFNREQLEKMSEEANKMLSRWVAMPANPNLPIEKIPTFYL